MIYISGAAGERDLANMLASRIRNYRLPGKIELPDSSVDYRRIFVDTEERPFGSEAQSILEGCNYFIILCSPESRVSLPVMAALSYFEEKRGKENVIAVLCKGEPAEAFPPYFIEEKIVKHMLPDGSVEERIETVEPVASDLRGQTAAEIKALLRYETVRIVATMMGLKPDALEQRHNKRRRRRITMVASIVSAALLSAGAAFTYFGIQAEAEGQIAARQAEQSRIATSRIMNDLPAMFANDPQALNLIKEGIMSTPGLEALFAE